MALATSLTGALTVLVGIEVIGTHLGADWRDAGRRLATVPILTCTTALGALLVAQELDLLTQTARLAVIGCLALISIGIVGRDAWSHRAHV